MDNLIDWLISPESGKMLAAQGLLTTVNTDYSNVTLPIPWMNDELAAYKLQTPLNWLNFTVQGLGDVTGPEVQNLLAGSETIDQVLTNIQKAYDKACPK